MQQRVEDFDDKNLKSTTEGSLDVEGEADKSRGPSRGGKDWRGGRCASQNIIPSSTGAAKAVGFRNKEGDKFPTLPPIEATCSNRVLVSMCATNLASSTPPTSRFFRSTTQQTHNPYWRRIEANIGCEELFSEQHRSATHQRNASKAEKDGLHLAGVRLLISRSFYPRRKELTRANSCSKIVTRDFNCSQLGLCSMHKKDSE